MHIILNFRINLSIFSFNFQQFQSRTVWHDMIGRHCPIYAVNREVTLRIQALQFCSDHKFAFSSLGFRVLTGFDSDTETGGLHWS